MVKTVFIKFLRRHWGHHVFLRRWLGDPQFTIIMATLNPGAKLRASLDSVLSQSGVSFELLIIDGGSTDHTIQTIQTLPEQVHLIAESEPGVYTAMNRGLPAARGEIIYFLGAGDRLRPGILQQVAAAWPEEQYSMLYGEVFMEDLGILYDGEFHKEKLRKTNICHQAIFYSSAIFHRHGAYDRRYRILADYDLNLKIFGDAKSTIKFIPEIIADYEGNGLSAGTLDPNFQADKKQLCEERLGPKPKPESKLS